MLKFDNLNEKQLEAVKEINGPILINAGAGSGKTRVLTYRIANMIEQGIDPYNILAITFTNKAADEMMNRVLNITKLDSKYIWISTFHSMCAKILRINADRIGYTNSFAIIDDDDQLRIIKKILKEKNYSLTSYNPKVIRNLINEKKYNSDTQLNYGKEWTNIVNDIYDSYVKRTFKNDQMDFQDLLINTIRLFNENEDVLEKYQNRFKYVLVDEFQDTNDIQYDIVNILSKGHRNVFVVGDADQSIYAFRGANMNNLGIKFLNDYPEAKIVNLEQNYRSTQMILNSANDVIKNNISRIDKTLWTDKGEGEKVIYYRSMNSSDEIAYTASEILKLTYKGYDFSDMAVLYRNNNMSRPYEDLFVNMKIPFKVHGGFSFYKRREVKDLTSYLRLIVIPKDNYSFERTINVPKRGIGNKSIGKLRSLANERNISLFEAVDFSDEIFGKSIVSKLKEYKDTIIAISNNLENLDLPDVIDEIMYKTGYYKMNEMMGYEGEARLENIKELKTIIKESQKKIKEDVSNREILLLVLDELFLRIRTDDEIDVETSNNYVKLMTVHSAKGLEFPIVFVGGFEDNIFPHYGALEDDSELEEERRLAYVAFTRAKDKLYITNSRQRLQYGNQVNNKQSCFIKEINQDNLLFKGIARRVENSSFMSPIEEIMTQNKSNNEDDVRFKIGDKVYHKKFEKGIVVAVDGDFVNIAFKEPHGIKKLLANHPSIEKV